MRESIPCFREGANSSREHLEKKLISGQILIEYADPEQRQVLRQLVVKFRRTSLTYTFQLRPSTPPRSSLSVATEVFHSLREYAYNVQYRGCTTVHWATITKT